ncbi:MAG: hypothetical protein JW739_06230 [Opitutales bacterium]|nr:hypothetical protein [Opitutales bacterium]
MDLYILSAVVSLLSYIVKSDVTLSEVKDNGTFFLLLDTILFWSIFPVTAAGALILLSVSKWYYLTSALIMIFTAIKMYPSGKRT